MQHLADQGTFSAAAQLRGAVPDKQESKMATDYNAKFVEDVNAEFQRGIADGHKGEKNMPAKIFMASGAYTRYALAYMAGLDVAKIERGEESDVVAEASAE
jgi:hypothetical protein